MNTTSSTTFHPLRVSRVQPDADDAVIVSFDVPQELASVYHFSSRQHLTLRHDVQGQDMRRSYSICAAPGEALRVGVRKVPGGVFYTWLHEHVRPGQTLQVRTEVSATPNPSFVRVDAQVFIQQQAVLRLTSILGRY